MPSVILANTPLSPRHNLLRIHAPRIARRGGAGQFVIVIPDESSERLPLAICDLSPEEGWIETVYRKQGGPGAHLAERQRGEELYSLTGPLGNPISKERWGHALLVGREAEGSLLYLLAKELLKEGNRVSVLLSAPKREELLLADRFQSLPLQFLTATDDGSAGFPGTGEALFEKVCAGESFQRLFLSGPLEMMHRIAHESAPYEIPGEASLHVLMLDGTGMCGSCRVRVEDRLCLACLEGPSFDIRKIDWESLAPRMQAQDLWQLSPAVSKPSQDIPAQEDSFDKNRREREELWRKELRANLSAKERTSRLKVPLPLRPVEERLKDFSEVSPGYSRQEALLEASRCLDCPTPSCMRGCPVEIRIPSFIKNIERGDFKSAASVLRENNVLPGVCGRVCPQEELCEGHCLYNRLGLPPVSIGALQRFAIDYALQEGWCFPLPLPTPRERIAVIGSGPASLSAAGELSRLGYSVTVFESLHLPGGVLMTGIPEFRLPKERLLAEIKEIKRLGVEIQTDFVVGKTATFEELKEEGYQAFFIGAGAPKPVLLNIDGEMLNGVYSAGEYLTRVNLMKAYLAREGASPLVRGRKVAVIGGGNTAIDCARTARRLGAKGVVLVYRRTEREMPARKDEISYARQEGIEMTFLTRPLRFLGDSHGWVVGMECQATRLSEPDASGRRRPVDVPGGTSRIEADVIVNALGTLPTPILSSALPGLSIGPEGRIEVTDELATSVPGIFAGGDAVRGGATVILAIKDGRTAARSIHRYLSLHRSRGSR